MGTILISILISLASILMLLNAISNLSPIRFMAIVVFTLIFLLSIVLTTMSFKEWKDKIK